MEDLASRERLRAVTRDGMSTDPVAENLLRQLLKHLDEDQSRSGWAPTSENAQDVVLDVCFDGCCYTLICSVDQQSHAGTTLSPREKEIVRLVAKGLPTKAIADVLDLSVWTVSTHLRRVFAKLGVNSRAEMVARVLEEGLL